MTASLKNALMGHETIYSRKDFDEDYSDSDGDGYENVFERALGLNSLRIDSPHHTCTIY